MFYYAANYIFDGKRFLKNAFVSLDENGFVNYLSEEGEALQEKSGMSFYNGILAPGFVNAHCHLELSGFQKEYGAKPGLTNFVRSVLKNRSSNTNDNQIKLADRKMYERGISLVGDISNTSLTIETKLQSKIHYKTFVEISGLVPSDAEIRYNQGKAIKQTFLERDLSAEISLHSLYSVSAELIGKFNANSKSISTSLHFLESSEETEMYFQNKGRLFDFLSANFADFKPICNNSECLSKILESLNADKLILVHNVQLDKPFDSDKYFYCLCPRSNKQLHDELPSHSFVEQIKDSFVIGTDSLASNNDLSIIDELKYLESTYHFLSLKDLLKSATYNGANALDELNMFGSLEPGKKPGLILIENADLKELKLGEEASSRRIV